ncbi:MAG TPA: response regulator, partial [Thermoanaerobaculia bacterium]|nr:response regulator [Thermoanaerobaculia bacterium]
MHEHRPGWEAGLIPSSAARSATTPPLHIAIVASDPEDRTRVKAELQGDSSRRHSFAEAGTGAEGLRLCEAVPAPDCVVLDDNLPDMTAVELLDALRDGDAFPAVPVVVLTREGDRTANRALLRAGAQDWFCRDGVTAESLSRTVEDAVERHTIVADERKRSGAALRVSEERYHKLFDAIDEGFCVIEMIFDAEGRPIDYLFHETNRAFEKYSGLQDASGRRMREMVPNHDDHWFEIYGRVAVTGEPIRFMEEAKALGRWFDVYASRVGGAGSHNVAVLFNDITGRRRTEQALRESEASFRQLADAMPQMVWVTRPDGYHEYYNRRWYEFTGVPDGSTDGEGWNGMFHPDDQERAWARWRQCLATGEPYEIEYRLRHRSGDYRWTLGRALPIRNRQGDIERWFGTCTDIEQIKRIESEREQLLGAERTARAEVERAGRIKDEFLATLSHELRTPLNAIVGWAQLLQRSDNGVDSKLVRDGIDVIARNAHAQAQLIADLLDMNRIVTGKLKMEIGPMDPNQVVAAAADTVRPIAQAKGVRLEVCLAPELPQIQGDMHRLQQVLWNLLSNAVKFTPTGGLVTASTVAIEGTVRLMVEDTGQGLDPAFVPYLFDRFSQADASAARKHGGLGLGLSIVKQLVELHGGTVSAESDGPGLGSRFMVSLPIPGPRAARAGDSPRPPALSAPSEGSAAENAGRMADVDLSGVSVLLVDDQKDALEAVRRLLIESGAAVSTATSAQEALELLREQRPHVLLSDIGMPGMDGYQLIREVRERLGLTGAELPAAAFTAFARLE